MGEGEQARVGAKHPQWNLDLALCPHRDLLSLELKDSAGFASEFYSFLAMHYVFSCLLLTISFPYCQVGISAQKEAFDMLERLLAIATI